MAEERRDYRIEWQRFSLRKSYYELGLRRLRNACGRMKRSVEVGRTRLLTIVHHHQSRFSTISHAQDWSRDLAFSKDRGFDRTVVHTAWSISTTIWCGVLFQSMTTCTYIPTSSVPSAIPRIPLPIQVLRFEVTAFPRSSYIFEQIATHWIRVSNPVHATWDSLQPASVHGAGGKRGVETETDVGNKDWRTWRMSFW